MARERASDFLAAKSVARAPDHLLRAIDQLGAAGWDFAAVELPALREVEAHFQKQVAQCGFELSIPPIAARQRMRPRHCRFFRDYSLADSVLPTGHSGNCFAPVFRPQNRPPFSLEDPRDETREMDEAWVGTWEQTFASTQITPTGEIADRKPVIEFLIGNDFTEQARAIAAKAVKFLGDPAHPVRRCVPAGRRSPAAGQRVLERSGNRASGWNRPSRTGSVRGRCVAHVADVAGKSAAQCSHSFSQCIRKNVRFVR